MSGGGCVRRAALKDCQFSAHLQGALTASEQMLIFFGGASVVYDCITAHSSQITGGFKCLKQYALKKSYDIGTLPSGVNTKKITGAEEVR